MKLGNSLEKIYQIKTNTKLHKPLETLEKTGFLDILCVWNYCIFESLKTLYFLIVRCFAKAMRIRNNIVDDEAWSEAECLTNALRPLLNFERIPEVIKFAICSEQNITESKFYRELNKLRTAPLVSSLLRKKPGPEPGRYLLPEDVEQLIQVCIKKYYLKRPKPTVSAFYKKLTAEFHKHKKPKPSPVTVWRRVGDIPKKHRDKCHQGAAMQNSKNAPATTHFIVERPMQIVQIDHTKADIQLIDSIEGKPIGRPIISIAIDLYTRMIVGLHIDLIGPSTETVAEVITSMAFGHDVLLRDLNISASWLTMGLAEEIHMDNGTDLKSKAIQRGCSEHGMQSVYGPLGRPNYRGHVERFFGTLMEKIHEYPGTTFSNVIEKGTYKSEHHAVLTISSLTELVMNFIVNTYHKSIHSSLEMTPEAKLKESILEGFSPRRPIVEETIFRTDFLNRVRRKVRREGLIYNRIQYWSEDIQAWYDNDVKHAWIIPLQKDVSRILAIGPNGETGMAFSKDHRIPRITRGEYLSYRKRIKNRNIQYALTDAEIAQQVKIEHDIVRDAKRSKRRRRMAEAQISSERTDPYLFDRSSQGIPPVADDGCTSFIPLNESAPDLVEFDPEKRPIDND